ALVPYIEPHVLVIDEVGYLSYGHDAANVLFHVVNERHLKKRPMIFTTNKPLPAWGSVLHDPDLAEAIIDRILERGRFIALDGPTVRAGGPTVRAGGFTVRAGGFTVRAGGFTVAGSTVCNRRLHHGRRRRYRARRRPHRAHRRYPFAVSSVPARAECEHSRRE